VGLRLDYDLPVDVSLRTGNVGGPSAGLMFSLAIYDVLTPGELTGGKEIAGTGTMEDDGTVGPIGGIRQKLVGAQAAGADFFLAPADNCSDVAGHVPDGLRVVRVATFDEGLAAVRGIASGDGASLPTCG
jgi:PDZ domain-containing protein